MNTFTHEAKDRGCPWCFLTKGLPTRVLWFNNCLHHPQLRNDLILLEMVIQHYSMRSNIRFNWTLRPDEFCWPIDGRSGMLSTPN